MQTNIIFHSIRLTLCFQQAGEIDNLTVKLGQSNLIVLCRFHVGTGIPGVAPHYTPSPTPSKQPRFPTGSIKPWFHNEGKLAAALIIPSSWVPNERVSFTSSVGKRWWFRSEEEAWRDRRLQQRSVDQGRRRAYGVRRRGFGASFLSLLARGAWQRSHLDSWWRRRRKGRREATVGF